MKDDQTAGQFFNLLHHKVTVLQVDKLQIGSVHLILSKNL